jgi:hypothetical protein
VASRPTDIGCPSPLPRAGSRGPALLGFLDLLERDIATRPDRLQPVPERLVARAQDLVHDVEVDLDGSL